MNDIILTDNGNKLLLFLQRNDQVFVGKDLIELTGIKGIYPVLNSLIKHGLVQQCDAAVRDFTNKNGKTFPKEYKTYSLTDKGRAYEILANIIVTKF
jgi:hypothetical protein